METMPLSVLVTCDTIGLRSKTVNLEDVVKMYFEMIKITNGFDSFDLNRCSHEIFSQKENYEKLWNKYA